MGMIGRTLQRIAAQLVGIALTGFLSGCGTGQDVSNLLVQPGKYDIYNCKQIADRLETVERDAQKLEGLMARASQGAGGSIVSAVTYDPEYQANLGEERELRKSAAAKNCTDLPVAPGPRASDSTIR
jgi:hypothetical protein